MTNSLEMTLKNIFFNSLAEGLHYWLIFIKKYPVLTAGLYITITGLAVFAQYSSNQFFGLSVFSLLFPLFIQFLGLFFMGVSCLFIVPYFFQNLLNEESQFVDIPPSFFSFLFVNFRPWMREMSKVLAVSYLWGLLLIVPGIIKLFKCSFVHYIVLFNPSYSLKKISALKHSSKLTKGFVRWFLLLVLFYMGVSYAIDLWVQNKGMGVFSLSTAGVMALKSLWTIGAGFFISITYHVIYLKREKKLESSEFYEEPPAVSAAL